MIRRLLRPSVSQTWATASVCVSPTANAPRPVAVTEIVGTYVVDINAMFFGMPMALFPAIAEGYGGKAVVGLLYAVPSAARSWRP
jgi:hypothetical protein